MEERHDPGVVAYMQQCSNWGRWGVEDERGTLNLLGPEQRRAALSSVISGSAVSASRSISPRLAPQDTTPWLHFMTASGEHAPPQGAGVAADWIGMSIHGFTFTHLDGPSHEFWNGLMYNGIPASAVRGSIGATRGGVLAARDGIVGRGVLLDIPRVRGIEVLPPSTGILPVELEAALKAQDTTITSGDLLLIRTGLGALWRRGAEIDHHRTPGLDSSCLPWLHEHDIALLGSDATNDVRPSGIGVMSSPIHTVAIVAMGLWLLDNADLESLAEACARRGRWDFLLAISPLALKNSTGSPVNPIAVL